VDDGKSAADDRGRQPAAQQFGIEVSMVSNVNPAYPVTGNPTTQSVRDNFQHAYTEITALQNAPPGGTPANPTATISGTAVNGVLTTFMRSDAAPALAPIAGVAGNWQNANITVDPTGRITAAASGTPGAGLPLTGGTLTGPLVVNLNTAAAQAPQAGTAMQISGADNTVARLEIDAYANSQTGYAAGVAMRTTRGSAGSPNVPLVAGDQLGAITFRGYGSAGYSAANRAAMNCLAAESWATVGVESTQIIFNTTAHGGTNTGQRLAIAEGVVVGGATGGTLPVPGDMGPGTINVPATGGYYVNGAPLSTGPAADTVTRNITAVATAPWAALPSAFNEVTTVAAVGNGCALPAPATVGQICKVRNSGANALAVYPAAGAVINALAAGAPITVPVDTTAYFEAVAATQWYTVP
jgi:hypothetical protein